MNFDLWTFFVENLFGSFWLSVLGIGVGIFVILAVLGKLSRLSVTFYLLLFLMNMTLGFGYKWLTVIVGFLLLIFVYLAYQSSTER